MKKQTISALLLAGALSIGVSACGQSNSAQAPQSDTPSAQSNATSAQPNNASAPDQAARAQRREQIRKQVEAVLTPEQAQQLQTKVQSGEKMRQALKEINLTADQKTKIQDILKRAYTRPEGSSQKG